MKNHFNLYAGRKSARHMRTFFSTLKAPGAIRRMALVLLLLLTVPSMQSCSRCGEGRSQAERQAEAERLRDGMRLDSLLRERDFAQALPYLDSLHDAYPRDPQFWFGEGWVHYMQDDSLRARTAFAQAVEIYDSLIAAAPNSGDMFNRAMIVRYLYGREEYVRALDGILSVATCPADTLWVEMLKQEEPDLKALFPPGTGDRE